MPVTHFIQPMSEKQDILVITQFYPPESMGGAHRWEKIGSNLDETIEPHILTTFPAFPFGEFERTCRPIRHEKKNGLPVTRLFTYQPSSDSAIGRIVNYSLFSILSALYVLLTFWRYDTVVTMSAPHTTFLPGLVGKIFGRDWFIDIFDLWIDNAADLGYVDTRSLAYRVVDALEYIAFSKSDGVFVITDTMAEYYKNKYPDTDFNTYVVSFGVDTEMFSPSVEPAGSTDIIYTGNLGTGQAFLPFLEAFAELNGKPELTIVGGGERRKELEDFVKQLGVADQVRFEGYIPRREIPRRLAGTKMSIVPLKTEYQLDYAKPTKLLESMATGTPYVASAVNEIENLSDQYRTGYAVENRVPEIRTAMENLLESEQEREFMGENSSSLIESEYNWAEIGKKVSDILTEADSK